MISVISKPKDHFFQCAHCFLIPRFPLVLKCGHPSCHRCFPESFRRSPKCNHCRAPVQIDDVMTLTDDRIKRHGLLTAKMYDQTVIQCTNNRCNREFTIDQINNHELFQCEFRFIKCPAKNCDYKNVPTKVYQHALQCPFHQFYCETCYGAYSAEVIDHSCAIMLKRRLVDSVHHPSRGFQS